jgi:hypothetical protein
MGLLALFLVPVFAHSESYATFYITDGTFASGGTFSGSFVLGTTSDIVQSAAILIDADGVDQTLTDGDDTGSTGYYDLVFDNGNSAFTLALSSSVTSPTLAGNYTGMQTRLFLDEGVFQDDATGATISSTPPSATPEPSSLLLLGTGSVGLSKLVRRKRLSPSSRG